MASRLFWRSSRFIWLMARMAIGELVRYCTSFVECQDVGDAMVLLGDGEHLAVPDRVEVEKPGAAYVHIQLVR